MGTNPDDRSPIARAAAWSSRIFTVALEMVLPGLAGYWLDERLGTTALFMIAGLAIGSIVAMVHLIRMTKKLNQPGHQHPKRD